MNFQMTPYLHGPAWALWKYGEGDVLEYLATIQQEGSMEEYAKD